MAILPGIDADLIFVAVASLFGHRLWAHHFSVLLPFVYLLPALLMTQILAMVRQPVPPYAYRPSRGAGDRGSRRQLIPAGSLSRMAGQDGRPGAQQRCVDDAGRRGARRTEELSPTCFPIGDFFTSFAFLTENRVPYRVDIEPRTIDQLKGDGITGFRPRLLECRR